MYIVFIKIIYVVSRKRQRTVQCRLYLFAEPAVVSVEVHWFSQGAPRLLETPHIFMNFSGDSFVLGAQLFWG